MVSPVLPRTPLEVVAAPAPRSAAIAKPGLPRFLRWAKTGPGGRSLPVPKNPRLWGLGLGSLALALVNGALVVSAGIGLVAYQQLLALPPRQRQRLIDRLQKGLPLPATQRQQALALALVVGTTTYTFSALWHSTHSLLMALLLTGQGALALYALGALVRSPRPAQGHSDRWNAAPLAQVDYNLTLLSHPDPLKRLVAVRRLARLASDEPYGAGVTVRSHLSDCFRLRLEQEPEGIVRSALEAGLVALGQAKALPPQTVSPWRPEPAPGATEPDSLPSAPAGQPPAESNAAAAIVPAPTRRPVEYVELDI